MTKNNAISSKSTLKKWGPEDFEEIACDFCGANEPSREFIRADNMRVVECAKCGLAYLNPRPHAELIPEFYKEDYFTGVSAVRGEGGLKLKFDLSDSIAEYNRNNILRLLTIIKEKCGGLKDKSILEIGCATGDLLIQIKKEGALVKGIEISDFAAGIARKRGLDVITGTIEDFTKHYHNGFDIVIALEVIEHVVDPTLFLKNCAKLLKPSGFFLLSTPNYSNVNRFGRKWLGLNASFEHLYFFSLGVLKKMSIKNNLTLKYWETSAYSGRSNNNFLTRRLDELLSLIQLIKMKGLLYTVNIVKTNNIRTFCPYGCGHTLMVVFEKVCVDKGSP